ncbi:MAG: class I mannose-6-phosphate isomerase [Planctomycetia bacterium]|nr:class I mannose-6-phosphate isomerase [Planctomycetia bacterium]
MTAPTPLHPFRFKPILRRHLWGGRRLESVLGKSLPAGHDYAESWEIVDHGADQSVVTAGPLAGTTLAELVAERGSELLGRHAPQASFPLLLKFIDAHQNLSVQVHPDDTAAAQLPVPDLGKTEAWYVVAAEPNSALYVGLKKGFDRAALTREIDRGTCALCMNRFEPKPGDCVFVPAGTVHAIGAGLIVVEIQQSSDTTFRVDDWGRVGPDGKPRALHVEQALEVIDFERGPVGPQIAKPTDRPDVGRLVECDKFVWDRWQLSTPQPSPGDNRCHLLTVLDGELLVAGDPVAAPLGRGESMLLPASLAGTTLTPRGSAMFLDAYLP